MRAILIAAGRGRRLGPLTDDVPKCYAEIGGRRILDWSLGGAASAGLDDVVFVGGYLIERVRADYPDLRFCHNAGWWEQQHPRLALLRRARDGPRLRLDATPTSSTRADAVQRRLSPRRADIALAGGHRLAGALPRRAPSTPRPTARRFGSRAIGSSRSAATIPPDEAPAEFTGVAKFTPAGARCLIEHYHRARRRPPGPALPARRAFVRGRT